MANRIQTLLGVAYPPVVQAPPMTYIARATLAAAVSEAGGTRVIETLTPEGRADLSRVRDLTDRPVAANLMIQGWKRDPSIVDVLAEANVRHVFTSAGDPALFTARLHDAGDDRGARGGIAAGAPSKPSTPGWMRWWSRASRAGDSNRRSERPPWCCCR